MTTKLLESDDFTIWQPATVEIVKGKNGADDERRIGGYCSTEHLDRQEEVVLQKGLDFSEFVQHGYFNDNHNQSTSAVVGVPDSVEYHAGKGWYTEGALLKGFARADEIWGLAKSLEDTKRRLGFSIEGKVIERKNNHIVKARIRNVAVTNCPVNPNCTWDVLAKSFGNGDGEDMERALTAGSSLSPTSGGGVLVPEDLEHDEVKNVWQCKSCKKAFRSEKGYEAHKGSHKTKKSVILKRSVHAFGESEAIALLKSIRPGYSEKVCLKLFQHVAKGV